MFCFCCARIVAIRLNQGRPFWKDLCQECQIRLAERIKKEHT